MPADDLSVERCNGPRPNVSVFIMTRNEEANIVRCLEALTWSNDIVLLDSLSTDATLELAAKFPNVRIFHRAFTDYADQRNHGLHNIRYANEWVLVVDADEVVQPELAHEVLSIAAQPSRPDASIPAYMLRRLPVFRGIALRRNLSAACWIPRLLRPGQVRYSGLVHERLEAAGRFGKLRGCIHHHQFAKGIDDWMGRRLLYAQLEWEMAHHGASPPVRLSDLAGGTLRRRALLKAIFSNLPARWLIYYLYNFLFRLSFLEGSASLEYIALETMSQKRSYYLVRSLKCAEAYKTYCPASAGEPINGADVLYN